jgi:hypothetical protein
LCVEDDEAGMRVMANAVDALSTHNEFLATKAEEQALMSISLAQSMAEQKNKLDQLTNEIANVGARVVTVRTELKSNISGIRNEVGAVGRKLHSMETAMTAGQSKLENMLILMTQASNLTPATNSNPAPNSDPAPNSSSSSFRPQSIGAFLSGVITFDAVAQHTTP